MSAADSGPVTFAPARVLVDASRLIARQAERPNDLSRLTVLLPDLHAAAELARHLRDATGGALLLPRLTSLRQWAAEMYLDGPVASSPAREAAIYHALSQRRWFEAHDLWSVAAELAALFDELTRWHVGMPASAEDFARRLERAYEARAGATFHFEARLVHELWHALAGGALDAEAAYQLRLGKLARAVTDPIYAVGLSRLAPAEQEFLRQCAARVPVVRIDEHQGQAEDAMERTLRVAWADDGAPDLQARARVLRCADAPSGLRGRMRFHGAAGAEQEARAIAGAVRQWLLAGCSRIAVVTLDRVVARRARALLERSRVLVRDEAGWPLSTTSAATAVGRWFDLAANDCYHRDLLDLLKSPFAFADWPRADRRRTVWRFEQALRRAGIVSGLERYLKLADDGNDAAMRWMLARVQRAAQALARTRRKNLSGWLHALLQSLDEIGARQGFEGDAAGVQLLELLETLANELGSDRIAIDFGEFRRWMARRLESAAFRDSSIESPIVFTSLAATRLRSFDAVLVMGADASRLPGAAAPGLFFNQRVRRDLGLPGVAEHARDVQDLLLGLLVRSRETLVTWQRALGGEPNPVSPLFERLRTLHALAWDDALEDAEPAGAMDEEHRSTEELPDEPTVPPAPRVPASCLPTTISASGYNTLMACPYQFHARYVLRLREDDEVQEELEKRDYGTRVHEILTRFHASHPRLLDLDPEAAEARLRELSEAAFAQDIAQNYIATAWLARWRGIIPRYVAWQREREQQGWRIHGGEIERSVSIETPGGRTFVLKGRIDRVDLRADGAAAVIDYKTRTAKKLKDELEAPGEDVQLPVYGLLWGGPVAEALYLSVDSGEVETVALAPGVGLHAGDVRTRLGELFDRMSDGAPLPAQGIEAVCQYCEMNGLCRRKHWS